MKPWNQFNKSCKMDVKFQKKFDDLLIKNLVLIQFVKSAYYFENFAVPSADHITCFKYIYSTYKL